MKMGRFAAPVMAAVMVGILAAGPACADGKLGGFKSKVSSGKVFGGGKISGSGASTAEAILIELMVELLIQFFPYIVLPQYYFEYCSYPYEYDWGYLVYGSDGPFTPIDAEFSSPVAFEFRGGYGVDFDGVQSLRAFGKARLSCYFNLDADFLQYFELERDGSSVNLSFFKFDGLFNVFNSPVLDLDWGFGVSYMDGGVLAGINLKFTGDIFPRKPLGIHFMACANAFEAAEVYETECMLGLFFKNIEVRAGYRAMWVEDIRIHGPIVEIAIWF